MNHRLAVLTVLVSLAASFSSATEAQTADSATEVIARPAGIWGLEFSPDGKWLAAGTNAWGHGG